MDRGERNEGTHGPGTGPDNNNRVKGASGRAGSRTEKQRVKVHNAAEWRPESRIFTTGYIGERTGRSRHDESASRNPMVGNDH